MRKFISVAALVISLCVSSLVLAEAAKGTGYSVSDTDIGTLLDDPAARAILDKYIPGFSTGAQVDMARPYTLTFVQPFDSERITEEILEKIGAELSKLPAAKK